MPVQIKRHLIILTLAVVLFIVVRQLLIPESFGDLGHYRANSLEDNVLFEMHYAGQETCIDCHQEEFDLKEMDLHYEVSCESCHGPSYEHSIDTMASSTMVPEGRDFCALCHAPHAARNKDFVLQVDMNEHNPENECTYCHNPHAPWELRNQENPDGNL